MNNRNKRVITILTIFTIIFTVMGGTLAYWTWTSDTANKTGVAFTIDKDFSCSADGGGHITPSNISLEPSTCDNPNTSIKRKIVVTPDIKKDGLEISLDLWLNINSIGTGLSNSVNFKYVLTTSESSCEEGVISEGNFNTKTSGDKVMLLEKNYTADASETYYLYIWLDKEESSQDTMNQSFDFSLGGNCTDEPDPEAPVLDSGMIPVVLGGYDETVGEEIVTTISASDPNWYDYENNEWANIVLVKDELRNNYLNKPGTRISNSDILAYYVWVPRYKYKIAGDGFIKCSDIDDNNPEKYPECYSSYKAYTMSTEDINTFASIIYNDPKYTYYSYPYDDGNVFFDDFFTLESCKNFVTYLVNGKTLFLDESIEITLEDAISIYDVGNEIEAIYETKYIFKKNIVLNYPMDIVFESKNSVKVNGDAENTYYTHPAFWWDNDNDTVTDDGEMLAGIWVGKYENTGYCDYDYGCVDESNGEIPTIKPHQSPYFSGLNSAFLTAKKFTSENNIYGLSNINSNSHMMKNSEWGAVAYLSASKYGNSTWPLVNEYGSSDGILFTGCGESTSCNASTTGNNTGIYGMAGGGAIEFVMGNYNNVIGNSGFSEMPERKYYDLYTTTIDSCTLNDCGGHALFETAGWDGDRNLFINSNKPWIVRGGMLAYETDNTLNEEAAEELGIFAFARTSGYSCGYNEIWEDDDLIDITEEDECGYSPYHQTGFRTVIINGFGE